MGSQAIAFIRVSRGSIRNDAGSAARDCAMLLLCAALPGGIAAQTLDRVAATKTVRIGYIADQAPFASKGTEDKPVGYAIDLCNRIVAEIDQRHRRREAGTMSKRPWSRPLMPWPMDQIDLLCGAITVTIGRRETVDFSEADLHDRHGAACCVRCAAGSA